MHTTSYYNKEEQKEGHGHGVGGQGHVTPTPREVSTLTDRHQRSQFVSVIESTHEYTRCSSSESGHFKRTAHRLYKDDFG